MPGLLANEIREAQFALESIRVKYDHELQVALISESSKLDSFISPSVFANMEAMEIDILQFSC